jgi:D-alanine-D-alanine ligase
MNKINVALLSGGISSEREVSVKGGDQVFEALDKDKYNITRYDPKYDLERLVADASGIDIALIILHGPYGEDGTVQGLLDLLSVPYQGSGVLGSALAMNKLLTKQIYELSGIPSPPYLVARKTDNVTPGAYVEKLGLPLVIKPVVGGSSIGMSIVKSEEDIENAITLAFENDDTVLIESYIQGTELTGGVLGNDDLVSLPIIEIIPDKEYEYFDYEAKYTPGATQEICPARIDDTVEKKAKSYAKLAHKALFCNDYSRTDMIFQNGDIFVLETNTIPGMTETSLIPLAAKAAGFSFSGLLDKLIELSMKRNGKA